MPIVLKFGSLKLQEPSGPVQACNGTALPLHLLYILAGTSVGIATDYGLDGPGSNPGGDEIFRTCPDRPWGPPRLLENGYRVFSGGETRPGRAADHSPSSSASVMEE